MEDSEDLTSLQLELFNYTTEDNGTTETEVDFGEGGETLRTVTLFLGKEGQKGLIPVCKHFCSRRILLCPSLHVWNVC